MKNMEIKLTIDSPGILWNTFIHHYKLYYVLNINIIENKQIPIQVPILNYYLLLLYIISNRLPRGQSVLTPASDLIMSMHLWRWLPTKNWSSIGTLIGMQYGLLAPEQHLISCLVIGSAVISNHILMERKKYIFNYTTCTFLR